VDQELKQHLEAMEGRIEGRMEKLEERLTEKMRDMQTELLRGFAAFS
jgi:chaperonin cofactor prefoldin